MNRRIKIALLAAGLLARHCGADVAATLDELTVPGLLAVAVCRLGEGMTGEGIGACFARSAASSGRLTRRR